MNFKRIGLGVSLLALVLFTSARTADKLILPGEKIGQTHLGQIGAKDVAKLPPATAGDQAMSQSRQVWVDPKSKHTLYIYTAQPAKGISVELIRITSPYFETKTGIKVGSTMSEIRTEFPKAMQIEGTPIYKDAKAGIAFEFPPNANPQTPSIALMIHRSGTTNYATADEVESLLSSKK